MPTLKAPQLESIAARLLAGAGASTDEAATVARHSVEANLTGHDSHGIIQIPSPSTDSIDQPDRDPSVASLDRRRDTASS